MGYFTNIYTLYVKKTIQPIKAQIHKYNMYDNLDMKYIFINILFYYISLMFIIY